MVSEREGNAPGAGRVERIAARRDVPPVPRTASADDHERSGKHPARSRPPPAPRLASPRDRHQCDSCLCVGGRWAPGGRTRRDGRLRHGMDIRRGEPAGRGTVGSCMGHVEGRRYDLHRQHGTAVPGPQRQGVRGQAAERRLDDLHHGLRRPSEANPAARAGVAVARRPGIARRDGAGCVGPALSLRIRAGSRCRSSGWPPRRSGIRSNAARTISREGHFSMRSGAGCPSILSTRPSRRPFLRNSRNSMSPGRSRPTRLQLPPGVRAKLAGLVAGKGLARLRSLSPLPRRRHGRGSWHRAAW